MSTLVIDTSVLLSDPRAFYRFEDVDIVLPLVVIQELENKRDHPELGYPARAALRLLEELRISGPSLTDPVTVHGSTTLRVEVNHRSGDGLPEGFKDQSNDFRILSVASALHAEDSSVKLLTKDLPMRLKASVANIPVEDYVPDPVDDSWTGIVTVDNATNYELDTLFSEHELDSPKFKDLPLNAGVVLKNGKQSALARVTAHGKLTSIPSSTTEVFGVSPKNTEQRIALALLGDPSIEAISLGGPAGTGKSVLALAAALHAAIEEKRYRRIIVFRPLFAVGDQQLGYLPGTEEEKMDPWAAAVDDALEAFCHTNVLEDVRARNLVEVLPLTHIRGRTLKETFVIIDEAQNLEKNVILTALSRMGDNSKVVITHDVSQRDNLRVGRHDGIASVVTALKGNPLFAHVTLARTERSKLAALATELLADT